MIEEFLVRKWENCIQILNLKLKYQPNRSVKLYKWPLIISWWSLLNWKKKNKRSQKHDQQNITKAGYLEAFDRVRDKIKIEKNHFFIIKYEYVFSHRRFVSTSKPKPELNCNLNWHLKLKQFIWHAWQIILNS